MIERADRQPAAERLGGRHRVGHDARLLVGPQRPGAPQARLDLVEDQRGAVARRRPRARRAAPRRAATWTPRLPLDRLDQHGGGALVDRVGDRLGVGSTARKPGHERRERRLLGLLRRRAQRAVGAPVEARRARRRSSPPGLALRASFSAASIASAPEFVKNTLAAQRALGQALRQPHRRLGVEEVADVHEPPGLLAHRLDDRRMAVADAGRPRSRTRKSRYSLPVVVPQARALAAHELDRVARVGGSRAALDRRSSARLMPRRSWCRCPRR